VDIWGHIMKHREEIGWAVGLAVLFAIMVDVVAIGPRCRDALRFVRNRMAERSTSRLAKRIQQLQDYQRRLSSDRWLYLFSFQCIFLTLIMFACAGACFMFTTTGLLPAHPVIFVRFFLAGLMFFYAGGVFAWGGLRYVFRDTPEKMQGLVHKVGCEIEGLEEKHAKRLEH
jgi:hypothetical protein